MLYPSKNAIEECAYLLVIWLYVLGWSTEFPRSKLFFSQTEIVCTFLLTCAVNLNAKTMEKPLGLDGDYISKLLLKELLCIATEMVATMVLVVTCNNTKTSNTIGIGDEEYDYELIENVDDNNNEVDNDDDEEVNATDDHNQHMINDITNNAASTRST